MNRCGWIDGRAEVQQQQWQIIKCYFFLFLSRRRSSCGVAALDYLYCIGGSDGTMCMSSGERFNLRSNCWEPINSMNSRRSTHEVVEAGNFLYALGNWWEIFSFVIKIHFLNWIFSSKGGNDGSSSLNSVERYDIALNKWTIVTSMFIRRSSIGAAVLECFNLERGLLQTAIWPAPSSTSLDKDLVASSGCSSA